MSNKISLNGYPAINNVVWTQTSGPAPSQVIVEMEAATADAAWKAGAIPLTSTLEITPDGGGDLPLKVEALSIIDYAPSGNPFTKCLVVADRRWLWGRKHVLRRYNILRRTGQVSVIRDDVLHNVTADVAKVGYAVWSLDGATRWTAQRVLSDIMAQIDPRASVNVAAVTDSDANPIQNLEIDDTGDGAVARALMQIPGITVTVERNGGVRFFNTLDQSEAAVLSAGPPVVGMGYPILTDHSRLRPREVVVYFNREVESRFDFTEVFGTQAANGIPVAQLENVLPSPDPELTLVSGQTVGRGQWITFDEAIAAWVATRPAGQPPLTKDVINDQFALGLTNVRQFAALSTLGGLVANVDWDARISVIMQCYRTVYRIPQATMQRIYQLRANRVAIINPVTGDRAPSPCWMDYSLLPSPGSPRWTIVDGEAGNNANKFGMGRAIKGYKQALRDGQVAPVAVSVIDPDLGIIQLHFRGDYLGALTRFVPGAMLNVPRSSPTSGFPRFLAEHVPLTDSKLDPNFGMATILTVAYGSPNDNRQLQAITVQAQEAEELIPGAKFMPADGPPVQLRVGPQVVTARFAWQDIGGMGAAVRQTIGLEQSGDSRALGFVNDVHLLDSQWINKDDCVAVARAVAAAYYAYLTDRTVGDKTTGLNPFVTLTGAMESVRHAGQADGAALTTASIPQFPPARKNWFALLPDKIRAIVMRLVQFP